MTAPRIAIAVLSLPLAGCTGIGAVFDPASAHAAQVTQLFWIMTVGGTLIWLLVIGLAMYATHLRPHAHHPRLTRLFVLGGGVVLPVVVLTGLLLYGLQVLAAMPAASTGGLQVRVTAEQWWWRVHYVQGDGTTIPVANEIRLPRGERVLFELRARDVIHSFWVPALAGKLDMIPGHVNRLTIKPDRLGTFRGTCAEYCGASHANMSFVVEVMEPQAFRDWLQQQAAPARAPVTDTAGRGEALFFAHGCDVCHSVRGTPARGDVGPDLTHVGGRHSLAAGRLPAGRASLERWIRHADMLKPQALMPAYALPDDELAALAEYLDRLQ